MRKLIFFNHYHRGDLFTHKEFIRHLKQQLYGIDFVFQYLHFNHPKVNKDLDIPLIGNPSNLNHKDKFIPRGSNTLLVNTWIGVWGDTQGYMGVNLDSLLMSWGHIYEHINEYFGTKLSINTEKEYYIPSLDTSFFNIKSIDNFIQQNKGKKVLVCNGIPMSNQSFAGDMSEILIPTADKYKDITFICTKKFSTDKNNILFTDDIIQDSDLHDFNAPWHDRQQNNCDLNEISYLSTFCDVIIGKNSGPFVFCETKENFMNPNKTFISFTKWQTESLSHNINYRCKYNIVLDHSYENIIKEIENNL
jgi:hypothetical protein